MRLFERGASRLFVGMLVGAWVSSLGMTSVLAQKKDAKTPAKPPKAKKAQAPKVAAKKPTRPQMDKYRFQLVTTEEKSNSLKEKIYRSKAQLMLLQETLLQGSISTAKLVLFHKNELGTSFYLRSIAYSLNGTPIFTKSDYNGDLNKLKEKVLYQGSVPPQQHTLTVDFALRGNGFGLFSYLRKYKFRVRSSYTFKAQESKRTEMKVVLFEKGRLTSPLDKRLKVRYDIKVREVRRKQLQQMLRKQKP